MRFRITKLGWFFSISKVQYVTLHVQRPLLEICPQKLPSIFTTRAHIKIWYHLHRNEACSWRALRKHRSFYQPVVDVFYWKVRWEDNLALALSTYQARSTLVSGAAYPCLSERTQLLGHMRPRDYRSVPNSQTAVLAHHLLYPHYTKTFVASMHSSNAQNRYVLRLPLDSASWDKEIVIMPQ